jgi:hypothetical protein
MRQFLFVLLLSVVLPSGGAVPGGAPAHVEQGNVQRRSDLRQALERQKDERNSQSDAKSARHLSPAQKAEMRRQLRDQSSQQP